MNMNTFGVETIAPLFPNTLASQYQYFDLSVNGKYKKQAIHNQDILQEIVAGYWHQNIVLWGGYGEKRSIYSDSTHFNDQNDRNIHLGIDIWLPANTKIYSPLAGKVHSSAFNNNEKDYGGTIILEHSYLEKKFYTLYGHLSKSSIEIPKNKYLEAGDYLGLIGNKNENGGWVPHLHFQVIYEIGEYIGDYPGVSTAEKSSFYLSNCPSPLPLISPLNKLV